MQTHHLLCGQTKIPVELPDNVPALNPKTLSQLDNPAQAVRHALADPIGTPPLADLAVGRKNACVVISDVTRPVPNRTILPPLLKTLEDAGIPRDQITILIATGMHRPNLGDELIQMVGPEIASGYRIINHYCKREEDLRQIAEIDGAPIEINRHYLDADLKILTGLIEPHMYAGFSGGRKSILPGISSYRTMQYMHSFEMIHQPDVTNCRLAGNPFHEAGEKVAAAAGVDFILNVVINKARELVGVFAGHYQLAHRTGCEFVSIMAVRSLEQPADLVITSAGGYPLDATFYQVSKGLIAARDILHPDGAIVMVCECREGLGSNAYCELVRQGQTPEGFYERYSDPDNFVMDQWCLQTTYQALSHAADVYVYSPYLSQKDLEGLGITKIDNVQAAVDTLFKEGTRAVVSPEGPYVVGQLGALTTADATVDQPGAHPAP